MKKLFVMLCAAVALFSCTKEYPVTEEPMASPMTFNLSVSHADADATKALKSGWEDGDVVYVFFKGIAKKYLQLSFNGATWTKSEPGGAFIPSDFEGITDPAERQMTAVYIPHYHVNISYDSENNLFKLRGDDGEPLYTYYMYAEGALYTVSGTEVSGTLTMEKPGNFVQFFVPGISETEAPLYRLREGSLRPIACDYVGYWGGVVTDMDGTGRCLKGFYYDNGTNSGVLFAGMLYTAGTPTNYTFQLVKNYSETRPVAEGTYETKATKTIEAGVVLNFPATSHEAWTYGKWVNMEDAGLWATGNLTNNGTSGDIVAPDETGKYYAWAANSGYASAGSGFDGSHSFNWDNAPYYEMGMYVKYTESDLYTVLDAFDDAATKNLGTDWRMPTPDEFAKLVDTDLFSWSWQTSSIGGFATGGYIVTCNGTGLSMFLPAAGYGMGAMLDMLDESGRYWSSTRNPTTTSQASCLIFNDTPPFSVSSNEERGNGNSVRPVRKL